MYYSVVKKVCINYKLLYKILNCYNFVRCAYFDPFLPYKIYIKKLIYFSQTTSEKAFVWINQKIVKLTFLLIC